jgi:hypothetical protein
MAESSEFLSDGDAARNQLTGVMQYTIRKPFSAVHHDMKEIGCPRNTARLRL